MSSSSSSSKAVWASNVLSQLKTADAELKEVCMKVVGKPLYVSMDKMDSLVNLLLKRRLEPGADAWSNETLFAHLSLLSGKLTEVDSEWFTQYLLWDKTANTDGTLNFRIISLLLSANGCCVNDCCRHRFFTGLMRFDSMKLSVNALATSIIFEKSVFRPIAFDVGGLPRHGHAPIVAPDWVYTGVFQGIASDEEFTSGFTDLHMGDVD